MDFIQPSSVKDTFHYVEEAGKNAAFVAGGTIVVPAMRDKIMSPEVLIDISRLDELSYIREDNGIIRIGALTTIGELGGSDVIRNSRTMLSECCEHFANPLVRNLATVGGNLVNASPAADTAVPLLALDAVLKIGCPGIKSRDIPLTEFFAGPNKTTLNLDELLKEIHFATPSTECRTAYMKIGLRNAMAISVVSIAVLLEMDGNECFDAKIALGAVAPTPLRIYKVESLLKGRSITMELIDECSEAVVSEISPITDVRASAEYRKWVASAVLKTSLKKVAYS